jgi:leucyl aminopeptidase
MKHRDIIVSDFFKQLATSVSKVTVSLADTATLPTQLTFLRADERVIDDFHGKAYEINVSHNNNITTINCGCGTDDTITQHIIRKTAAFGIQKAQHLKWRKLSVIMPEWFSTTYAKACVEGLILGAYKFEWYKRKKTIETIDIELVHSGLTQEQLDEIYIVCSSTNYARNLVNKNAIDKKPEILAAEIQEMLEFTDLRVTILTEDDIKKQGLGLIQAVSSGAAYPPRLVIIEYNGQPELQEKIALIGKGIIFDTGGLDLKEVESMRLMKRDMAGCATVMSVMQIAAALRPQVNIVAVLPMTFNSVDAKSYMPGDTHTAYNGKTVEVDNTDAEGRLILVDAIAYCQKNYKPTMIIDIATLTKTVKSILGQAAAGLFTNDKTIRQQLLHAGRAINERLWPLPIFTEYHDSLQSDIADIKNSLESQEAKSSMAAAFIQEFVENNTPWAHLDIANVAFNEKLTEDHHTHGEIPHNATGFGVRLLWQFLKNRKG